MDVISYWQSKISVLLQCICLICSSAAYCLYGRVSTANVQSLFMLSWFIRKPKTYPSCSLDTQHILFLHVPKIITLHPINKQKPQQFW